MKTPHNILVIVTRRYGDVLLATPLMRSLRRAYPHAKIDALVFAGTEGILHGNPDLSGVVTIGERPGRWEHFIFLRNLWRRYDLAISTMPNDRPTLYAFVAGRVRIGMIPRPGHWKRRFLHNAIPFDDLSTHTVRMNLVALEPLKIAPIAKVVPPLSLPALDHRATVPMPSSYAVIHVFPKFEYKKWTISGWVGLIDWLAKKGIVAVLVGGRDPEELAYAEEIIENSQHPVIDQVGELSFADLSDLLAGAAFYVGCDTSVSHLAAAVGIKTLVLFGPSNPVKWGPWPIGQSADKNPWEIKGSRKLGNVFLVQGEGDCVPCRLEGCQRHINSVSDCLVNLPLHRVTQALNELEARRGDRDVFAAWTTTDKSALPKKL